MENKKTDLRIIKTKKAIKETFLEMRKTIPLEKIRVRDICAKALINKSTFYSHYADAFALSEELEDEAINAFLDKLQYKDCLFSDPERFLSEMPEVFDANMDLLQPLFKDRMDVAFQKIKVRLKAFYTYDGMTQAEEIRLNFIIGGTLHTMQELKMGKQYDDMVLAQNVSMLIGNCEIAFINRYA